MTRIKNWSNIVTTFKTTGLLVLTALSLQHTTLVWAEDMESAIQAMERGDYEQGLKSLATFAAEGNKDAQYAVGLAHYKGLGTNKNFDTARYWFQKAAEQKMAHAAHYICKMKAEGAGVPQSSTEAFKCVINFANKGVPFKSEQYSESIKWALDAAKDGNAFAQAVIGQQYLSKGGYLGQDVEKAIHWLSLSTENGSPNGQYHLGSMYLKGNGVEQDIHKAIKLFKSSSRQNNPQSQNALGRIFRNGTGVPQDFVTAHMWFNLAASNLKNREESKMGANQRRDLEKRMTASQIAEAQERARKWSQMNQ